MNIDNTEYCGTQWSVRSHQPRLSTECCCYN